MAGNSAKRPQPTPQSVPEAVAQVSLDGGELARGLYLDLIKRCLLDSVYGDQRIGGPAAETRAEGFGWPAVAHTMIGPQRLGNLQHCVEDVIRKQVPGDLIETGVWRGGSCILMRAILQAHGVFDRRVFVADSFEGLPAPDAENYPYDAGLDLSVYDELAISLEQVQENFRRYGLLDERVQFLKGWFKDTLPNAPIDSLAVMRLDGDLYESTIQAFEALYPKLSVGGYVIVDDYGAVAACAQATHDFRDANGIDDEIVTVDATGVFWQRTR